MSLKPDCHFKLKDFIDKSVVWDMKMLFFSLPLLVPVPLAVVHSNNYLNLCPKYVQIYPTKIVFWPMSILIFFIPPGTFCRWASQLIWEWTRSDRDKSNVEAAVGNSNAGGGFWDAIQHCREFCQFTVSLVTEIMQIL